MQVMANLMMEAVVEQDQSVSNRVLANRRNALKSTGPRTAEGKAISRRNAVKHGLSGAGIVMPLEMEVEARERTLAWCETLRPVGRYETEIVELAATTMTQYFACCREESLARCRLIDRAERVWDTDRDAAIMDFAAKLSEQPGRVVAHLKRTAHGAAWLHARWHLVLARLEKGDDWSEDLREHALDLLGVDRVFRDGLSPFDDPDADADQLRESRMLTIQEEMNRLEAALDEHLIDLDNDERLMHMSNLIVQPDEHVTRFSRMQQTLSRRVLGLMKLIRRPFRPDASKESPRHETNPNLLHATNVPRPAVRTSEPSRYLNPDVNRTLAPDVQPFSVGQAPQSGETQRPRMPDLSHLLPPHFKNLSIDELVKEEEKLDPSQKMQKIALMQMVYRKAHPDIDFQTS